ncbi:MAG: ABC transporter ATP-binding protein, partial [Methylotenera sp.]
LLLWASTKLSFATGTDLGISIYQRTLYQPYKVHISRNSSELINGISVKANGIIYSIILPLLTLISSSVMLVAVLVALIYVDPVISLLAFCSFGLLYGLIARVTREKKIRNSHSIARESTQVIKSLQEGLGGIRDVLIDGTQTTYCNIYRNADVQLRNAQANNQFIGQSPRYLMESLGMIIIAGLAFMLANQSGGVAKAIPVLGALALGAQRLLPVMQQTYASWSSIHGGYVSLQDTLSLLDQPLPSYYKQTSLTVLPFSHSLDLKNVSFQYSPDGPYVLNQLNLSIKKGARVGVIGTTGSGKSTLLDVVMGLLEPTTGQLDIDGQKITPANYRGWQAHIAHVPQAIFLADTTVEENIAFGVALNEIDHQRVRDAANQAQLSGVIEKLPQQYKTLVGERGVRLSGGQRQRIGIARALYKQADVFVFDEATSALDNETEESVMSAIENLGNEVTVLIIAHRLTTLKNCNQIIELAHGKVLRVGTYEEIISNSIN